MDLTRRRFIPLLGALVVGGFSNLITASTCVDPSDQGNNSGG